MSDGRSAEVQAVVSTLPLVLVVDDNPENLTVIGELLQPGHAVRAANGGARALRLVHQQPRPDLVLLDVMMPDVDGYAVLAAMRADPATADIPVIFLTALNSPADEEHGLSLGAVDYVTKPIRPPILLARVRTQLQLKASREANVHQSRRVEDELLRALADAQRGQDAGIHALARLAEAHDPQAAGHLRRTQAYVRVLACALQRQGGAAAMPLNDAELALLVRAAPLHDIGNGALPAAILAKPGPLSDAEWALVKTHTRLGADALAQAERDAGAPVDFLRWAQLIAHSHHERWDGAGYPDGLAGDAIPLPARLMALADAFDALVAQRGRQPPLSFAQAHEVIQAERRGQFDPQLVDAFAASFDALCAIAAGPSSGPDDEAKPAAALPASGHPADARSPRQLRAGARCSRAQPPGAAPPGAAG